MKMKKVGTASFFADNPFTKLDWVLFAVLAIICSVSFQQSDIIHTATGALGYLNGHFWDFYEYGDGFIEGMNYMPSTFLLFAIWDIPLYLCKLITVPTMGVPVGCIMWFKLLPILFYFASAILLYKIALQIGLKAATAKGVMYLFLIAPIGFFSQFIFGQYDVFTVFFMLLGFYYFSKNERAKFILFFALAITFKYFALLLFLPLLLLLEKDIKKIIGQFFLVLIPIVLETAFYIHSAVFRDSVLGFSVTTRVLSNSIAVADGLGLSIVIAGWVFLCGWAYFTEAKTKDDTTRWSVYFCNLVTFVVFGFSLWHPQWLLIAVPFWILGTVLHKKRTTFFWVDILLYMVFLIFVVNTYIANVDQTLFAGGIFREFFYASGVTMSKLFIVGNSTLLFSLFTGLLMVSTVFKHPKFTESDFSSIDLKKDRRLIRNGFIVSVLLFVIPATVCLYAGLKTDVMTYQAPEQSIKALDEPMTDDASVGEVFVAQNSYVTKLGFTAKTEGRENDIDLTASLIDTATGTVLNQLSIDTTILADQRRTYFDFPATEVEKGKTYALVFTAKDTEQDNTITLCRGWRNNNPLGFAVVNGERRAYDLDLEIYGK